MVPAFKNRVIAEMRPTFQAHRGRAHRRVRGPRPGRARLRVRRAVRRPDHLPAARAAAGPLAPGRRAGPTTSVRRSRSTSATRCRRSRPRSTGLAGYVEEVVADRRAHPRDDLVTTLVQADGADRPRAVGGAGLPRLRRHGDHPQPARSRAADPARRTRTSGAAGRAARARRQRGRGGDAGQPDRHLGDPRGARGRGVPGPAHPEGRHRADAVARGRHRPARRCRTRRSTSPSSARRTTASAPGSTTAWVTSSPAPTWRWRCRCWPGGCRTRNATAPACGCRCRGTPVRCPSRSGSRRRLAVE